MAEERRYVPAPMPLALVLCDYVHIDPITGRRSMLGTFHRIESGAFPVTYPKMAVYAAMTDGRGCIPITIRLIDVDEELAPLWSETWEIEFLDPWDVQEVSVEAYDTPFDRPGSFRLELLAAGSTIMERNIVVQLSEDG